MRTFDEIKVDVAEAISLDDVNALLELIPQLDEVGTQQAAALAAYGRGLVSRMADDNQSALMHFEHARNLYDSLNDRDNVASLTNRLGTLQADLGNFQSALVLHERAMEIYEDLDDQVGMATVAHAIGRVLSNTGDHQRALERFMWALSIYEEQRDEKRTATICVSIGNLFADTGEYSRALEYYGRALFLHEQHNAQYGMAIATGNMGTVYADTGDYPRALEWYHRALSMYQTLDSSDGVARMYNSIGILYVATRDFQRAMEQYNAALSVHQKSGRRASVAHVRGNIGVLHFDSGDYREALKSFGEALALYEDMDLHSGSSWARSHMVLCHLKLDEDEQAEKMLETIVESENDDTSTRVGLLRSRSLLHERSGDLEQAHLLLLEALAIADAVSARNLCAEIHEHARDLAQKRKDFEGYIHHNNEYHRINDEIRGTETTQKLAMIEAERKIEAERRERDKERALLYGALPESVATRMLRGEDVNGDHFDDVSILFLDIVNFTTLSDRIPPGHVVHLLEQIFSALDDVCADHGLTKIKTIGDSYMAAAGVPEPLPEHVRRTAACALAMMETIKLLEVAMPPELGDTSWVHDVSELNVRIGIHCGPVTAGVIGKQRLQYDVWGDTVNVASRMESTGEPGRVQCSESFERSFAAAQDDAATRHPEERSDEGPLFTKRGTIEVKGKGSMTTYWLESA